MLVLNSQGQEVGELVINPSSNLLLPVKVRVNRDEVGTGNHPIHFEMAGQEEGPMASEKPRGRDEKSSFIVPR